MQLKTRSWARVGRLGLAISAFSTLAVAGNAMAETNVGVSVNIGQPGFYGRVDVGNVPPAVLYPQPVIIQQTPVAVYQRPIYMRVPPGHAKNWSRYCGQYRACGQPVYFVRDSGPRGYDGHDDHDHDHWHDRDSHDHDRGHDRGHGRGKGHGHGHR